MNYREQDFVAAVKEATGGRGVDVVLDVIGARYLDQNLRSLATGGRLVVIGLQGGTRAELDLGRLLSQRLSVHGTTLRSRSTAEKAAIVARWWNTCGRRWRIAACVRSSTGCCPGARRARRTACSTRGENIGKVLLQVREA